MAGTGRAVGHSTFLLTIIPLMGFYHMKISYKGFVRVSQATVAIAVGVALLATGAALLPFGKTEAASLLSDGFGSGSTDGSFGESPAWTEGGDGAEKRASSSGNDSASPDGGRFAVMFGEDGYICRSVDAIGYENLQLSYYWRGDSDAGSSSDDGLVQYRVGGTCSSSSGWTELKNHDLRDDSSWYTQSAFALPGSSENATFLLRFRADSNDDDEHFRVDGVSVTGDLPDTTNPTVTINQDVSQSDPTDSTPIHFKVQFSESVTGFGADDVLVSGSAGGSNVSVTGSGSTYNVYVNNVAGNGTVIATIPQGSAKDASDNESEASTSTDNQVTYYVNTLPTASDDSVSTSVNTPKNITLSAFDADGNPLTYTYSQPTHGEVTGTGPNVTYTPDNNFADSDSFTFYVNDGYGNSNTATISILVTPVCDNDEHLVENTCVPNEVEDTCDEGYVWNGQMCIPKGEQCNEKASFVVLSDANEEVDGGPALSVETWEHPAWLDESGDGAKWIWNTEEVANPSIDETHTFTDTFTITGTALGGTLSIAADNGYDVELNGQPVCSAPAESSNYGAYQVCNVDASLFVNGENTLSVEVKNLAYNTQDPHTNPAGVIYKLDVAENECDTPITNSCIFPHTEGTTIAKQIGESPETTLQTILNNAGYSLLAGDDQKNFENWTDAGQKVYFTATFLDKFAGHSHVFGYFVNGGAFVPVFRNGAVDPAYMGAPLKSPGDNVSFEVNNVNDIEFAIADWNASTNTFYSTDASDNADGEVHALVYNPDDNEYVLAFEDLAIPSPSDEDYNDFVVALTVDRCENGATCEPGKELLENGDFEDTDALGGSKWNIFASDTIGWLADWLAPAGAPEIANLEIQEEGLNGWLASDVTNPSGTQWTELDSDWGGPSSNQSGEAGGVAISQTIETVPGETYTVSFDFSPRPGTAAGQNAVEVLANNVVIGSASASDPVSPTLTAWSRHSFSFEADSYETTIALRDAGTPNDSLGTFVDNVSAMCNEPEPTATLVATKIVCENESYLPNWGEGQYGPVTSSTAQDFVNAQNSQAEREVCWIEPDWQFEWVTQSGSNSNPGDNLVTPAGAPWTLFGEGVGDGSLTTEIPVGELVWVREVLKPNYTLFSSWLSGSEEPVDDVSAEIYCSTDVLNYDNWDWIDPVEANQTYYCVAFNAPTEGGEQCNPEAQHVLLSSDDDGEDLLTLDESGPASLVSAPHANWYVPSEGAWIWKDISTSNEDAANGTDELFTRTFEVIGTPFDSTLTLAADNGYEVRVNGNLVCADAGEHNYENTVDCAVPASYLQNGTNTITFEVTNIDHETANDPSNNPAGLYYKLVVNENECVVPEEPTSTVTMCKTDEDGYALSGWSLYLQGAYVENLVAPVNNGTGVTSSGLTADMSYLALASGTWLNDREPDNYVDAEYSTENNWLTPMDGFTGYGTNILELEINGNDGNWGPYSGAHVYAQSFIQPTDSGANFAIDDSYYGDNSGSFDVSLYEGYAGVTGENGCVTFEDVPYGSYTAGEIMQDGWAHYATWDGDSVVDGGAVVVNGESEYFTIQNRANKDEYDDEDGEGTLVIKKLTSYAENGEFDFDIGGNESFYDADVLVNNGTGETSLELPSGTYSLTETQQEDWEFTSVDCEYEGESEGSDIAYGKQITLYDGETITCTFRNAYDEDSGGSSGNQAGNNGPAVLGASTVVSEEQSCGPLLNTYLRLGGDNQTDEVAKLQDFLNGEMGSGLPLTGIFGPATDTAVRAFQIKYWEDVLQPWFGIEGSAIQDEDDSTGYVYKTTRWKINNLWCPGSEALPVIP